MKHRVLTEEDRYYIDAKDHNNCVLCLVEAKGSMTQEEVGKYFGLSKMRISQIEKQAIKKLQKKVPDFFK